MSYDYSVLEGIIAECFGSQKNFAKAIGMSEHSVSMKLNNKIPWKQTEIEKVCTACSAKKEKNYVISSFFILNVQN
ncbi:MAG: DUF739 family protein [Ruminococcaceae bacterium]|nr:DUF739 family protein [Oscillospiraceae bacterium]